MATWVVWGIVVGVAALLGLVGYHFSVRTLRWVAGIIALGLALAITAYGLRDTAPRSTDLESAFALGADRAAAAFFNALGLGGPLFGVGRVGWVVIVILLVLGYRTLEVWALHFQAPQLDASRVSEGQPSIKPAGAAPGLVDGLTDGQRHDQLAATLKFRLAAMEVRAPAILPGGTRSGGLATIAEASGVSGAGLAGAIIRFFGMLWPNPRQVQLRVWVEPPLRDADGKPVTGPGSTRVTAELDNPRTGETISSKTLAATDIDSAATKVAGYVARQIFAMDPSTPPWCIGMTDGSDLSALLRSRQERVAIRTAGQMATTRSEQIRILSRAAAGARCAGVVRYELAQLYSISGTPYEERPPQEQPGADREHLTALRLHAVNREQHPRFYRGRYRLGMCLEMVANPAFGFTSPQAAAEDLNEILAVLRRCRLTGRGRYQDGDIVAAPVDGGGQCWRLSRALRLELLEAAQDELRMVRRQLTIGHVLWAWLAHRDERTIWKPYFFRPRMRQSFHDGACVGELLVAVRRSHNRAEEPATETVYKSPQEQPAAARRDEEWRSQRPLRPRHLRLAIRVAAAIAGNGELIRAIVAQPGGPWPPPAPATDQPAPEDSRDRVRWLPWQRRTASWQAAYNTACLYAALTSKSQPAPTRQACEDRVVVSLQRAVNNPHSEMERASDWISRDPDFSALGSSPTEFPDFSKFLADQQGMDYPYYVARQVGAEVSRI